MRTSIVLALVVAVLTATASLLVSRRVRPAVATRVITTLAAISATATLWIFLLIGGSSLLQLHGVAERLSWCSDLRVAHRDTLSPVGAVSVLVVLVMLYSVVRVRARQRRLRATAGSSDVAVLPSDAPAAFALPGRPGQIVVSRGMLDRLEPDECRVLFAHERAHLRCGHHRYVRLTELAAAAVPVLAPLNRRVRYATERWADEEAAREIGDRQKVARAIAHAAIAQTNASSPGLAMADTGVLARVESLLTEAPAAPRYLERGLLGFVIAATAGLAVSLLLVEPVLFDILGLCR